VRFCHVKFKGACRGAGRTIADASGVDLPAFVRAAAHEANAGIECRLTDIVFIFSAQVRVSKPIGFETAETGDFDALLSISQSSCRSHSFGIETTTMTGIRLCQKACALPALENPLLVQPHVLCGTAEQVMPAPLRAEQSPV
jgi:hypothetical protein